MTTTSISGPMAGLVLRLALALALITPPEMVWAAPSAATMNFDLKDVALNDLVKTISKLTGRNFLLDGTLSGNVTLIAPQPVSTEEAWRIFLTIMAIKNYALEKSGSVYKIIPAKEAINFNVPIVYGRAPYSNSEEMIVRMIPLDNVRVTELEAFLKNFKGRNGNIYTFTSANMLVIVDTSFNINRMLQLIDTLDKPAVNQAMQVLTVKNSSATEMAKLMSDVYGLGAAGGKPGGAPRKAAEGGGADANFSTRAIPDDRTNQIILIGPEAEIKELIKFAKKFDIPVVAGTGQIHVYYLKNADATSLADTLSRLTQTAGQKGAKKEGDDSSVAEFEGGIKITADKETNSLIVVSSPSDFTKLQELINKLDRQRQQVYVEAAVVEVALGSNFDYGLNVIYGQEQTVMGKSGGLVFGGAGLNNSIPSDPLAIAAINGIFGGAAYIPSADSGLPPIGVMVRALQGNDNANVLSTPHLLTSDNKEAEIVVGDNVPFITGQNATSGGNVLTTVERRDVGLTLRITPQINESDRIRLEIYQEISSVSQQQPTGVDVNKQGLITRKRSAKTSVVANDRQTIVIGGLISNEEAASASKVPILGDIPIIGRLFRSKTSSKKKTNLLIFLTPRIVRDRTDYDDYALESARRFWQTQKIAPSRVGFKDFFSDHLPGWSEDGEDSTQQATKVLYEGAAVDRSDASFAGEASEPVAVPVQAPVAPDPVTTTETAAPAAPAAVAVPAAATTPASPGEPQGDGLVQVPAPDADAAGDPVVDADVASEPSATDSTAPAVAVEPIFQPR